MDKLNTEEFYKLFEKLVKKNEGVDNIQALASIVNQNGQLHAENKLLRELLDGQKADK